MKAFTRIIPTLVVLLGAGVFAQDEPVDNEETSPIKESGQAPLTIDEQISFHVQKLAVDEKAKRMEFMGIVIDDIARLCELDPEQVEKLNLAAKGATKRSMERWHEQADRYFRTRVSGADTDTASEILSNIGAVNFGGRDSDREGELQALWKDSLKTVLTDQQISNYYEIKAQRKQAKIDSYAQLAVSTLDDYLRLTPNQRDRISPIISESANEYLDEIQRYWGDYLEKNMLMSLVNAADEKTLSGILSSNQMSRLRTATTNLDHFWDNRRRLKKAKDEAQDKVDEAKDAPRAEAIKLDGNVNAGRVRINAGGRGAVIFKQGAVIRGGEVEIIGEEIRIGE